MSLTAGELIAHLGLLPHPEGGYYREIYRAQQAVGFRREGSLVERAASTSIYFLLSGEHFSAFHRIRSDEVWHFYAGAPLRVVTLAPEGHREDFILGSDVTEGHSFQAVVPAGRWFGASLLTPDSFCLVGCTVAPGFEFADFELARRSQLQAAFPSHHEVIQALTRED